MKTFKNITEIKQANKAIDNHFFDREAMRFFNSKVESKVLRGRYFVTSEIDSAGKKRYSVRMVNDDGSIETIGGFHTFKTIREAKVLINNLPEYFPDAFDLAKMQFNQAKWTGMSFVDHALVEPTNNEHTGYERNSFCGACTWICENHKLINAGFLTHLYIEYRNRLNDVS